MTITARVVLAIAFASLAATAALLFFAEQAQREAIEARVADAVIVGMSSGGREQCELDPTRFVARSARGQRAERTRSRGRVRFSPLVGARFAVYSHEGASLSGAPSLDAATLAAFDTRAVVALPSREGLERYLVHMPWEEGPCAIVGVERTLPEETTDVRRRGLWLSAIVLAVASLAAVTALRTPLRRLRALTDAAKALGRSGFRDREALDRASPRGASETDEVGALARSLRDAVDRIASDAERLSARDEALTEYVVHTTHDLMTPVTVLTGHLAEVEDDLTAGRALDPKTVSRAIGEAHYLATLIANLGVVARLDRPDAIVQTRELDLRDVIERVVARHEPLARARGLSLEHAVPDAPCRIEGDDLLLERALGNLVHNAIRHHRAQGEGEGHVALVLSGGGGLGERGEGALRVQVIDDGAGLDDATLARLRASAAGESPAESEDAVRTRRHGFGMDVVRRVAALHGMDLHIERAEEGGLSVTLSRPAARA